MGHLPSRLKTHRIGQEGEATWVLRLGPPRFLLPVTPDTSGLLSTSHEAEVREQ